MKELFDALEEWRAARQAIFDTRVSVNETPTQFARLANAEHKLMDIARTQKEKATAK